MRILLIFPHYNDPGMGSSVRSWQIGRFLAAKGHDVLVFAPGVDLVSGKLFPQLLGKLYSLEESENVKIFWIRTLQNFRSSPLKRLFYEAIFALLTFIIALRQPPADIVVFSQPPAVSPLFGYGLARWWRVPAVFEVRDLMSLALNVNQYLKNSIISTIGQHVEAYLAKQSQQIICVSPGLKRYLLGLRISDEKISVVTNGYEPEVFVTNTSELPILDEIQWDDYFVVIYTGALTQSYDIETLLRAAKRLQDERDILIVIIGEGNRKTSYLSICEAERLNNVKFLPAQARQDIPRFIQRAQVGVHLFKDNPLWESVLGNKTFDYLGSGVPMLYAGNGDTAALIDAAGAGKVVPPEDDAALADAILWFKSHPELRREMGEKGQAYVKTQYNRHVILERYEAALLRTKLSHNYP